MRKAQKKQIEDLLALLEQAHNEIKRLVENKNYSGAMELLGQCQDSAVQVGEMIEKTEGENAPTIARLEEYCETLYEIHEELSAGTVAVPAKLYKRLRKSLILVQNSVKNDIKIRLEMVFMTPILTATLMWCRFPITIRSRTVLLGRFTMREISSPITCP